MTYWERRQQELNKAMEKDEEKLKKRLSSYFDTEYRKLEKQIAAYYKQYGTDNVIQYRRLMESLPDADKRLLIEQMDEFAKKYPEYAHLLPVRESIYKLNRLEGLQYSVRMQQLEIGAVENEQITEHLNRQAMRGANAAAETMGFGKNFYSNNPDITKLFVNIPWSNGENFSQKIWNNTTKLANYLNSDIAQAIARGDSYDRLTRQLRQRFGKVSRNDAYRLIYTEGTYVMNEARAATFEADTEEYIFRVQYDKPRRSGWRDICDDLDGKVFKYSERKPGINFPPMHPWCHCTATPHISDRDKWMDAYEKRHGNGQAQKVAGRLGYGDPLPSKPANKFGQKIIFDDNISNEKWSETRRILTDLAQEYNTRLTAVSRVTDSKRNAGSVGLTGDLEIGSRKPEVAFHEFAHSITQNNLVKYDLGDDTDTDFWKEIKKIRTKYRKAVSRGEAKSITGYANENADEFFAEAFAHAKMRELGYENPLGFGTDFTYSQQVLDTVNKYFKKSIAKDSSSGIIKANKGSVYEGIPKSWKRIEGADDSLRSVNPNYMSKNAAYKANCTNCVSAYEMRKRGYNVTARPATKNHYLSRHPEEAWKDPDIKTASGTGLDDIISTARNWPENARAEVAVAWKGSSKGHVFVAEKENGKIRFYDVQSGEKMSSKIFAHVEEGETLFWRIDNLEPSDRGITACEAGD